jgi:hypothetical protein
MSHDQGRCFRPYCLAGPQGPRWCGAEVVAVPPKALAVLWTLVGQAGQVVAKDVLRERVWPETVVSESVLGERQQPCKNLRQRSTFAISAPCRRVFVPMELAATAMCATVPL